MNKYRLIDYHDVCGNEEEGWDVNDMSEWPDIVELPEEFTMQDIVDELKYVGFAKPSATADMLEEIPLGDVHIELQENTQGNMGKPLCRLERIK